MTDKKRITIYVSHREYDMIKRFAELKRTSMSKVLCGAIRYLCEKDDHIGYDFDFHWGYWFKTR